jgi:hypothetical protein
MKKIFLLVITVFLLLTSCEETLQEYNPSGITAEAVYTTPDGFDALVNAAYGYQRMWYGKEQGLNMSEIGTDIWMSAAGDIAPDMTQYLNLQGTNGLLDDEWNALYGGINLCNTGINRIENAGYDNEETKNQREAELRFLRAFYYWHIVETWGGVHFTLEETTGIVTTANKTPVETFYEQIFKDLKLAIPNLPVTTSDYGRVTKGAAMSFLARMYLTRKMYAEANAMARAVIYGNFGYELLPNYADLWDMENNHNNEIVYAVNYATDLTLNDKSSDDFEIGHSRGSNNAHMMFLMKYDNLPRMARIIEYGRPFNRYMPTRALLDMYSPEDGRYDASFMEIWMACTATGGELIPGDTAVIATRTSYTSTNSNILVYNRDSIYNTDGTVRDRLHYPTLTKHMDPTRLSFNEAQSARDAYVIRFAELYMIAAEAEMYLNKKDSAAYFINQIRTRAAKTGQEDAMLITAADVTLDFILDERAREFAGEQLRWFDLKRTDKLLDRIQTLNPDAAPNIQPYHIVRPIPQSQLDAVTNRDEFTQNEGYQ